MQRIEELAPKQQAAIVALLAAPSVYAAAEAADISPPTLYRWLRDDAAFAEAYKQARREAIQQAVSRLSAMATAAVETAVSIMLNPKVSPHTRLRAAVAVMDMAFKAYEQEQIVDRLDLLEDIERERSAYVR